LVLAAKSVRQRAKRARVFAASLALAVLAMAQTPDSDGIKDLPVHPAIRNLLGRLLVPFMDPMTMFGCLFLKQYPVKQQQAAIEDMPRLREVKAELFKEAALEGTGADFDGAELYELFDLLPPASSAEMLGKHYSARVFNGGGLLEFANRSTGPMRKVFHALGMDFGKRYVDSFNGHPLGFYFGKLYFPFLFWGNVTMLNQEHRGRTVACMTYDTHPYRDAFVRLGQQDGKDVLLGTWEVHGAAGGFFLLKEK